MLSTHTRSPLTHSLPILFSFPHIFLIPLLNYWYLRLYINSELYFLQSVPRHCWPLTEAQWGTQISQAAGQIHNCKKLVGDTAALSPPRHQENGTLVKIKRKKQAITNADKHLGKGPYVAIGTANWAWLCWNQCQVPHKTQLPCDPAVPPHDTCPESMNHRDTCVFILYYCNTMLQNQSRCLPTREWMKKYIAATRYHHIK